MSNEVHRMALRATAKVALSLTVVGCGAQVEVVVAAKPNEGSGGARAFHSVASAGGAQNQSAATAGSGGASASGTGGAGGKCESKPLDQEVVVNPDSFACCSKFLENEPVAAWSKNDPKSPVYGCCHEIIGQINLQPSLANTIDKKLIAKVWPMHPEDPSCCDVLGNPCGATCGCTVWGPPVPRAVSFLRLLDDLELDAEVA